MSDTDSDFLQTSWHYDKETKMDVAKVVFIFDGIATIDPSASIDEHKDRMTKAVNAARDQVGNVAALFHYRFIGAGLNVFDFFFGIFVNGFLQCRGRV